MTRASLTDTRNLKLNPCLRCTWQRVSRLSHYLLIRSVHLSRRLEARAGPGFTAKYSSVECGFPSQCHTPCQTPASSRILQVSKLRLEKVKQLPKFKAGEGQNWNSALTLKTNPTPFPMSWLALCFSSSSMRTKWCLCFSFL